MQSLHDWFKTFHFFILTLQYKLSHYPFSIVDELMSATPAKRQRVCLTAAEKREIYTYAKDHAPFTTQQVAEYFGKPHKTVADIIA
jgi:hypothetical protein